MKEKLNTFCGNLRISERKHSFVGNVFILTLSTIFVKVIGLIYKIPMLSLLGAEGMGYYNSAYEIFSFVCVLATTGLPVALSLTISVNKDSEDISAAAIIYRAALVIFSIIGILGTAIMLFFPSLLSGMIGNSPAASSVLSIAPSLLFICISASMRGYFQGHDIMMPTAVSQLIEAFGKLIFGYALAYVAIKRGFSIQRASAFACLGLSISLFISALYLIIRKKFFDRKRYFHTDASLSFVNNGTLLSLLKIAFPITLGSIILGLSRIIDMTMLLRRLCDIGYSAAEANRLYGSYTTLALPLFGLVPSLVAPISLALIPKIGNAINNSDGRELELTANTSLRLTTVFSIPASLGIFVYSKQILSIFFKGQNDSIEYSYPLLSILGLSVVFSCLITTTNALLQAHGNTFKTLISLAFGAMVKAVLAYLLIGIPAVGPMGAPISTLICDMLITVLNLFFLKKEKKIKRLGLLNTFVKPFVNSIISVGVVYALYIYIAKINFFKNNDLYLLIAILSTFILYLLLLIVTQTVRSDDLKLIPFFERILSKKNIDKTIKD